MIFHSNLKQNKKHIREIIQLFERTIRIQTSKKYFYTTLNSLLKTRRCLSCMKKNKSDYYTTSFTNECLQLGHNVNTLFELNQNYIIRKIYNDYKQL